jgi:hypothetical protein
MPAGTGKKKRADTSAARFQSDIGKHTIPADKVRNVLELTLAFMVSNDIFRGGRLCFILTGPELSAARLKVCFHSPILSSSFIGLRGSRSPVEKYNDPLTAKRQKTAA